MSELEYQLRASMDFILMRKAVAELTAALAAANHDLDILRAENQLLELKLQRLVRPRRTYAAQ